MISRPLSLITLLACMFIANIVHAQPGLAVVGGEKIDLGYVPPGKVEHQVKLVNSGSRPLKIVNIWSESATVGDLDTAELSPGDTATLHLSLETIATVGEKKAWVEIETDNPDQRYLNINLRALVNRPLYSRGAGGGGSVGEVIRTTITLYNMSPERVTLSQSVEQVGCCDCHADVWADLSGIHYIDAGDSVVVPIGMVPRRAGNSRCELEFRTGSPDEFAHRVVVTCWALEPERED